METVQIIYRCPKIKRQRLKLIAATHDTSVQHMLDQLIDELMEKYSKQSEAA